jgi:hypothetical protein
MKKIIFAALFITGIIGLSTLNVRVSVESNTAHACGNGNC